MYTSPYPINLVAADAVVVKHGHVLVVERADTGKLACPGGFVGVDETTYAAAIRELKEETGFDIMNMYPTDYRVFDRPDRSPGRGRIISHAYFFNLPNYGGLPQVKGADDARRAYWITFHDVLYIRQHDFFEDHQSIIYNFISKFTYVEKPNP